MPTATEGRNTGRRSRTMTSDNTRPDTANKASRRQEPLPEMEIVSRPMIDVLDHGLEDYKWHYVWVNVQDPTLVHEYYLNDYRFVSFDDVKEQLQKDERRSYLYQPDVNNRVSYGEQNRLMRIPQTVFKQRMGFGLAPTSPAQRAQEAFEASVDQQKYAGNLPKGVAVTDVTEKGDREHGETEKVQLDEK